MSFFSRKSPRFNNVLDVGPPTGPQTFTSNLTGGLSFIGSQNRDIVTGLAVASLSFVGAFVKKTTVNSLVAAILSFSGTFTQQISKVLTASLSFVGTAGVHAITHTMTASLLFVGAVTKSTVKASFTGTLSFVGAITKRLNKSLSGTLSFIGTAGNNVITHTMTGALSFVGAQTKVTAHNLTTATLSFTGSVIKQTSHFHTGTLSFIGLFNKSIRKLLTATLSFIGISPTRSVSYHLAATLSFVGVQVRSAAYHLTSSLSFVGTLTKTVVKSAFTGTLSFSGALIRMIGKTLSGTLSFVGTFTKRFNRTFTGALSYIGAFSKTTVKVPSGVLSFAGASAKLPEKQFSAALAPSNDMRLVQNIEMEIGQDTTSGTNNTYIEMTQVATKLNTADFDGTVTFYFETTLKNSGANGTIAYAQLYNHTDSVAVSGSELTQVGPSANGLPMRMRSGPIILSGDKIYTVQVKHSATTTATAVGGSRIVVVQTGNITKTQIHQQIGAAANSVSTSNTNVPASMTRFLYEATKYDGTVSVRHDAVIQASAIGPGTTTTGIYDVTGSSVVSGSEVSTSSTSAYSVQSSGTIILTDGHIYQPTLYVSSGSGSINGQSNKLVFTITGGFSKYLTYLSVFSASISSGSSSNSNVFPAYEDWVDMYPNFDLSKYSGSLTTYYEATISISNAAQTAHANLQIYDYAGVATTNINGTDVTHTGDTSIVRVRSSGFTMPSGSNDLISGIATTNASNNAFEYNTYLILEVTGANTGFFNKSINYHLTGTSSFVGSITRQVSHALAASLNFAGVFTKRTSKQLVAATSFAGSVQKNVPRAISGVLNFAVGVALGSISRVQYKHTYPGYQATFSGNIQVGNSILVSVSYADPQVSSFVKVTDNLGNSYKLIRHVENDGGLGLSSVGADLFIAYVQYGGACTITIDGSAAGIDFTAGADDPGLTAVEYSGLGAGPTISSYALSTPPATPYQVSVSANQNDMIYAMWADEQSDLYSSPTSGLTLIQHDNTHLDAQAEYLNIPSNGSYNAGFNLTSGTSDESVLIVAVLSPRSGLIKSTNHHITAGLNFIGNFTKAMAASMSAATLSFIGSLAKTINYHFTATLNFVGSLATLFIPGTFAASFTATLSFVGNMTKSSSYHLSGALSFIGNLTHTTSYHLTANLSFIGSVTKNISKTLSNATLSFIGSLTKRMSRALTGTLSFSGNYIWTLFKNLSGSLSYVGNINQSNAHHVSATLSFVGSITIQLSYHLATATLSFVGAIAKTIQRSFGASFTFNNLAVNGSFEVLPSAITAPTNVASRWVDGTANGTTNNYASLGWATLGGQPNGVVGFDTTVSNNGSASLKLSTLTTGATSLAGTFRTNPQTAVTLPSETFPISPSTKYTITGYIKTNNAATNAVFFDFRQYDTLATNLATTSSTKFTGTNSFTQVSFTVTTNASAAYGAIIFRINVTGNISDAWFDNITVTPTLPSILTKQINTNTTASLSFVGGTLVNTIGYHLGAVLSFVGNINIRTTKLLAATLSFAGSLSRQINKALSGSVSFIGSYVWKLLKNVSGTLNFIGNITTQQAGKFTMTLAATLNFSGSAVKLTSYHLAAGLSFIGSLVKSTIRKLTASVSFAGSLAKQVGKTLTASINYSGSISESIGYSVSAALAFVSSQSKRIAYHLQAASLSSIGLTVKTMPHSFTGSLGFVGSFSKQVGKSLAGVLSYIGKINSSVSHNVVATLTFIGSQTRRTSYHLFAAILNFSGTTGRAVPHILTGTLSFVGQSREVGQKTLTAAISFIGSQTRAITHNLSATLSFVGTLARHLPITLVATITFIGSFFTSRARTVDMAGSLTFTGNVTKTVGRGLTAGLSFFGSLVINSARATISPRHIGIALSKLSSLSVSIRKIFR